MRKQRKPRKKKTGKKIALGTLATVMLVGGGATAFNGLSSNDKPSNTVSSSVGKMTDKEKDSFLASYSGMVSSGYRPYEVEKELKKAIEQLDKEQATTVVNGFLESIQTAQEYFNQLLYFMSNEISYSKTVDSVDNPVKDAEKITNELAKGYLKEMNRQHLLVTPTEGSLFIEADSTYVLKKYGKNVTDNYKEYLNLLAKEQTEPTFDAKKEMYKLEEIAERILSIDNSRDRWEKENYAYKWQVLEKQYYEIFFSKSQGTFYDESGEGENLTYTLKDEVIKSYIAIAEENKGTTLAKEIEDYLAQMKKVKYQETEKTDKYVSDFISKKFPIATTSAEK